MAVSAGRGLSRRHLLGLLAAGGVVFTGGGLFTPRAGAAVPVPQRVVTLGGPVSEIAEALIGPARIVGVDTTTTTPATLADKPRTGYLRQLAAEGVLSLRPDLILAQHDAGPPEVLAQVRAAGVRVEQLPPAVDGTGLIATIHRCGAALGATAAADALAARMTADLLALPGSGTGGRSVLFLLIGHSTPMAAGGQTPIDGLISMAGARNAFAGQTGWKPVSAEALLPLNPDVLLVSDQALKQTGGIAGLQAMPLLAGSAAVRRGRVLTVEASLLQGLGPRTPAAARDLADRLAEIPA
ncbi:heme/hemin ABC transporter substrate-binding protein [Novispirillum itersonii]|uniref:heme/hemin ABC transporter substrate-binding protein n=1 Tax=Novispirillum itersonii TaxID=189 RepID=UPI0003778CB8|nr:ABC transporter substrate-binding protein [Novispirillum itersonii]